MYEYKYVSGKLIDQLMTELTMESANGWEVVTIMNITRSEYVVFYAVLKRRK